MNIDVKFSESRQNFDISFEDTVPVAGPPGKDGLTPFINELGNWQIGAVDTGIKATGKDGLDGQDGKDGQDGYTPVKGIDYFTEDDKSEMIEEISELLNNGVVLTDQTTQQNYRIFVSDGDLMMEEIESNKVKESITLIDQTTKMKYEIYVDDGELMMEVI